MGKHKNKKKCTMKTKLLYLGLGIILGMLILAFIMFMLNYTNPQGKVASTDVTLTDVTPSDVTPSDVTPGDVANKPGAIGGRRLFKNRFR